MDYGFLDYSRLSLLAHVRLWLLALRCLLLRLGFRTHPFQPLLVEVALELAVGHDFILAKVIEK